MLPIGGLSYNRSWSQNDIEEFGVVWDMNELESSNTIYDNRNLGVVVFVQNNVNEGSREVYQAQFTRLSALEIDRITGLEDELDVGRFKDANLYPNPASDYINVSVSDYLNSDVDWKIVDQRGVLLQQGIFNSGENNFEIDTSTLPDGLFLLIASKGSEFRTIRKIVIRR